MPVCSICTAEFTVPLDLFSLHLLLSIFVSLPPCLSSLLSFSSLWRLCLSDSLISLTSLVSLVSLIFLPSLSSLQVNGKSLLSLDARTAFHHLKAQMQSEAALELDVWRPM